MGEVYQFLDSLAQRGICVWLEQGELKYRAPRGMMTDMDVQSLLGKRDLIIAILRKRGSTGIQSSARITRFASELAPLTFQQEGLWELLKRAPNWKCLMRYSLRILGGLNVMRLSACLETIRRRHETLRTRVVVIDGVPMQKIDDYASGNIDVVDVSELCSCGDVEQASEYISDRFFRETVDLLKGPLLKIKLLKLRENDHIMLMAIHHMVSDHESIVIMFRELWQLYRSSLKDEELSLPELQVQYSDYAAWQRATSLLWLKRSDQYWKEKLTYATRIQLPVEQSPFNRIVSFREHKISFGRPLSSHLRGLARRQRTMPAMAMLAIYASVVHRWSRQRDFVIPFNVSGRHRAEHDGMIGFLSQRLYLRIRVEGTETLVEMLETVRNEFVESWKHIDFGRVAMERFAQLNGHFVRWIGSGLIDGGARMNAEAGDQERYLTIQSHEVKRDMEEFTDSYTRPEPTMNWSFNDINGEIVGIGFCGGMSSYSMKRFAGDLHKTAERMVGDPKARLDVL